MQFIKGSDEGLIDLQMVVTFTLVTILGAILLALLKRQGIV